MKPIMNKAIKDQKGQTLIIALILLAVGVLIAAPLLSYMVTGLRAGGVYERKADELYAADAGVEDAVLKIQNQVDDIVELYCGQGNHTWSYNISDVNDKRVDVTVAYVNNSTYRVVSTATGDRSGTKIDAYITLVTGNYSGLLDHILTSRGDLEWKNKVTLNYTGEHGPTANYTGPWPTPGEIAQFYLYDVQYETNYHGNTEIDLRGNDCPPGPIYVNDNQTNSWPSGLGPLYVEGGLEILNSSNDEATLTLHGTLYVTGDTLIGQNGKLFTLDLNGHTIFVESASSDPDKALIIGGRVNIMGPGVIAAIGDVYFAPNGDAGGEGEPVFVFSCSGTTTIRPGINIYGAVAGSISVEIQSGNKPTINYPLGGFGDINFPGFTVTLAYKIASWEVGPI